MGLSYDIMYRQSQELGGLHALRGRQSPPPFAQSAVPQPPATRRLPCQNTGSSVRRARAPSQRSSRRSASRMASMLPSSA